MATIPVVVKHQGKKYDVEVDPSTQGEVFKFQLFSLTGVEPARQKILIKGGQLKDDADMSKLNLKAGQVIMMMGTPSGAGLDLVRPKSPVKFVEDMTEAEAAQQQGATPAGLVNLGNTCYLNSTLQALRSIPELVDSLGTYKPSGQDAAANLFSALVRPDLVRELSHLYKNMKATQGGLAPSAFLSTLRQHFPQFAQKSKSGPGFAQQDAEEAWSEIVTVLRHGLQIKDTPESDAVSFVDRYMAGEFVTETKCDEEGGEAPVAGTEPFYKLDCHITVQTNHLRDGLADSLSEKREKKSELLGRDANYTKTFKISRLPKYLTVHFVRFFWRKDTKKKAKIMRKVTFPKELDLIEFCTEDLKSMLAPVRDKVREIRKDEEDIERARKRRKMAHDVAEAEFGGPSAPVKKDAEREKKEKPAADGDTEMAETYKTDAEVEAEQAAALLAAKKELHALVNQELKKDEGSNQSGLYELRGLVTHQGSSADSGHYTAYIKKPAPVDPKTGRKGEEDGNWWWFNDDRVSEVTGDKIESLYGGGESHSALILLYRAIELPGVDGTTQ